MSHFTSEAYVASESCTVIDWYSARILELLGSQGGLHPLGPNRSHYGTLHVSLPYHPSKDFPSTVSSPSSSRNKILRRLAPERLQMSLYGSGGISFLGALSAHWGSLVATAMTDGGYRVEWGGLPGLDIYIDRALYIFTHYTNWALPWQGWSMRSTASLMATRDFENGVNLLGGICLNTGTSVLSFYGDVLRRWNSSLTHHWSQHLDLSCRLRLNAITLHDTQLEGGILWRIGKGTATMPEWPRPLSVSMSYARGGEFACGVTSSVWFDSWKGCVGTCFGAGSLWPRPFV
eukprot:PhF_6_TR38127/c0_g1_i1/m.56922